MKRAMVVLAVVGFLAGGATTSFASIGSGGGVVSIGAFDDALAPHGEWLVLGGYGRVWRPSVAVVGVGFRPYVTGGHWVYTDYGWSFESVWDWGWAPFHYGRWLLDPLYGWVWVPDTVWGPAWVSWRFGGGYSGWAPLPPRGARIVIERHRSYWCFVETRHFVERDLYRYSVPERRYHEAFAVAPPVTARQRHGNARYHQGPPPGRVSAEVGRPIQPTRIHAPRPGVVAPHRTEAWPSTRRQLGQPPGNGPARRQVPTVRQAPPPTPRQTLRQAQPPRTREVPTFRQASAPKQQQNRRPSPPPAHR
ncbi:MAG: DUF6600 domain-containing protein [Myxococcaceae bacterium]